MGKYSFSFYASVHFISCDTEMWFPGNICTRTVVTLLEFTLNSHDDIAINHHNLCSPSHRIYQDLSRFDLSSLITVKYTTDHILHIFCIVYQMQFVNSTDTLYKLDVIICFTMQRTNYTQLGFRSKLTPSYKHIWLHNVMFTCKFSVKTAVIRMWPLNI